MANTEHLEILKQGVEAWNEWRIEHVEVRPDLSGAILIGANLRDANLSRAYLSGANLTDADIGWTTFADLDLGSVKGLDTLKHHSPSSIGIDTFYNSQGEIPESFLRGCGVPDTFITFSRSLVNKAIDYYSCFISYSGKNQALAERLYADLQSKGVRCWLATEDLKIGDKTRPAIDEAIRTHEKLLLVLSKHSVESQWVEQEVEGALEKERKQNRTILFPIRIDDTVMKSESGWAAYIKRTRNIGDFKKWKDHDSYRKAFDRLLRDLKAESRS